MDGISIQRGDSDAGLALAIRLISSTGNLFEFNTRTSAYDAPEIDRWLPGGAPGATPTYVFDRFTAIGAPDWAHINAIQVELSGGGSAAWVDDLRIVTPEPGTALSRRPRAVGRLQASHVNAKPNASRGLVVQ